MTTACLLSSALRQISLTAVLQQSGLGDLLARHLTFSEPALEMSHPWVMEHRRRGHGGVVLLLKGLLQEDLVQAK